MDSYTSTYHQKRGHMFFLEHSVVFYTKHYDNIPTRTPSLMGASNAGGVDKNRDSRTASGFIACCDRLGVISTVPPDRARHFVILRPIR